MKTRRKSEIATGAAALVLLTLAPLSAQTPKAAPKHQPITIEACVPCHGYDGISRDAELPHLAGQNERYLYNQLKAFQSGGRKHPEMRFMTRTMTEQEIESLASYYAALPAR